MAHSAKAEPRHLWFRKLPLPTSSPVVWTRPRRPVSVVCRILCCNVWGLFGNLIDLTSHTVVPWNFGFICASHFGVAGFRIWSPFLVASVLDASAPEGGLNRCEMNMEHFANPHLSVVAVKCWPLEFSIRQNFYVFSTLPQPWVRWPDFWLFTNINGCRAGRGCLCLFPVCVTWIAIITSGWVLPPRIVVVSQPLILQLCLVAISWLSPDPCPWFNT